MARPKKTGTGFTVTPTPVEAADAGVPTEQANDVLEELEDEGQRPTEGRIYRFDPTTRKIAQLDTVDASVIDGTYLRDNYGGGDYSVYFWGPKKDGSWGYLKGEGKRYRIDSSIPFKGAPRDRAINAAAATNGHIAPPAQSTIVDLAMVQLLNGFQEQAKSSALMSRDHSTAMMAMMERLASPRDSGLEKILAAIVPIAGPLIAGLMARKDPVELATQIAALSRNEKSGLGSVHELLELKDALALLGGGNSDGDGEAGWMRILEKVIPGAVEILKHESEKTGTPLLQLARKPAAARTPALGTGPLPAPISPSPASASSAEAPSPSPAPAPMIQDEWTGLEPHMVTLAAFAAQNKEPYAVVQTVKTLAPGKVLAAIRELVAREDAVSTLLARFPVLQPHAAWTAQLLEEFYAEFFGEDEGPDGPADEMAGHVPDPIEEE
jgi:hypothetical protein